jgi:hypothetical protein
MDFTLFVLFFSVDPIERAAFYWWDIFLYWALIQGTYYFAYVGAAAHAKDDTFIDRSIFKQIKLYLGIFAATVVVVGFIRRQMISPPLETEKFGVIAFLVQYLVPIIIPTFVGVFAGLKVGRTERVKFSATLDALEAETE